MTLRDYWKSLSSNERSEYANRIGVSSEYLRIHLIPVRKKPRDEILYGLSRESESHVSHHEVLDHFYPENKQVTS